MEVPYLPSADKIRGQRAQNSAAVAGTNANDTLLESTFFALSIKVSLAFLLAVFAAFWAMSGILSADGTRLLPWRFWGGAGGFFQFPSVLFDCVVQFIRPELQGNGFGLTGSRFSSREIQMSR